MERRNKEKLKVVLGVSIFIVVLSFLIYWAGIMGPKKEVILKKEIREDEFTSTNVVTFGVFYKWDGIEQEGPWWIIFTDNGKWKVAKNQDFDVTKSSKENRAVAVDFNSKWISDYQFEPQNTRYQLILVALGLQPSYDEEKKVFYEIFQEIKRYEGQN